MSDKERFLELWQQWSDDTMFCSYVNIRHPAWTQMLAFGKPALPWLFEHLVADPHMGMWRLITGISGEHPEIRPKDHGRFNQINNAYVAWGRAHGYLGAERKFVPE